MNDCDEGNDDDLSKPIYIRYKSTWHLRQFSKFDVHFQYRNYQFSKTGLYVCIVLVCCSFCVDDGYQWNWKIWPVFDLMKPIHRHLRAISYKHSMSMCMQILSVVCVLSSSAEERFQWNCHFGVHDYRIHYEEQNQT